MKTAYTSLIALFAASSVAFASTAHYGSQVVVSDKYLSSENAIAGQYIVVLDDRQFPPSLLRLPEDHRAAVQSLADQVAFEYRAEEEHVYFEAINGFSARMSRFQALRMANDPRVQVVAEDATVYAANVKSQPSPPSWGLDRIDQYAPELDGWYRWVWMEPPAEVHVYVLDTGIRSTHEDFGGRVDNVNVFNAYFDGNDTEDCNGHGTHIAGTIGGAEYGIAKSAILHPVRVLACSGAGSLSAVIAGVDWVTREVIEHQHPAVANLSLQSSPSAVLDMMIRASVSAGVTYVVAAGNSNRSACYYSPSRVGEAITVGAMDQNDLRLSTSNYGSCVDVYAPGQAITSTFRRSDTDTLAMTGTSTAAAHVSGIAAQILAQAPFATPAQVADRIVEFAGSMVDPRSGSGYSPMAYSLIDVGNDPELGNGGLELVANCDTKTKHCSFESNWKDGRQQPLRFHWSFGEGCTEPTRDSEGFHDYGHMIMRAPVVVEVAAELEDGSFWVATTTVDLSF